MTKSQIKAELRRSACEDINPYKSVAQYAFDAAGEFRWGDGVLDDATKDQLRIFFLLVAEAL